MTTRNKHGWARRERAWTYGIFATLAVAPVFFACGPKADPGAGYPTATVPTGPTAPPPATQPTPWGTPTPTAPPPPPTAPTAAPTSPGMGDALDWAITQAAVTQAPGFQKEGDRFTATVENGKSASTTFQMVQGKCYKVIVVGMPPSLTQLQAKLMAPPFYTMAIETANSTPLPTLANAPMALLGKGAKGTCPSTAIPMIPLPNNPLSSYRVDVTAKTGAGQIAVQVYSKASN